MKKRLFPVFIAGIMVIITACGSGGSSAETPKEGATSESVQEEKTEKVVEEETESVEETVEAVVDTNPVGSYTSFAIVSAGDYIDVNLVDMVYELTLNEGGTGTLNAGGEDEEITWEVVGDKGDRVVVKEDPMEFFGPYENGILEINILGNIDMLFAKENADFSSYDLITSEEEFKKQQEESVTRGEEALQNILKRYGLKNDDTHFVINNLGMIMCYEMDGDISTGSKAYVECFTERQAGLRKEQYERSSLYDSVEIDGTIIIIDMGEGMTREFLEEHYSDRKIDPK